MRKFAFVFIVIALFGYQKRAEIYDYLNPPLDYAAAHGGKVILYGTAWCGYCAKMRDFMDAKGIDYFEYDIEKSQEGQQQYLAMNGRGIPLLLVKGEVVRGYDPERLLTILQ